MSAQVSIVNVLHYGTSDCFLWPEIRMLLNVLAKNRNRIFKFIYYQGEKSLEIREFVIV